MSMSSRSRSSSARWLLLALIFAGVRGQPPSGGSSTDTSDATYCDMCGGDATYTETIDTSGTYPKRVVVTNGCPNHYAVCTGKGTGTCGEVGEEGTGTEALVQDYTFEIPAEPVIATTTDDTPECVTDSIGIALNGVPIYSGAVSANCDILDVDDEDAEWTSFDFCGGHGRCLANDCTGDYHYHYPPSCLETQIGPLSDSHSPQLGWSLDGFPIYGPFGPGGITMTHTAQGCTGDYCLDECSGLEMDMPDLDHFKYRYYFNGPLSDLSTLPTTPMPATSDYPFALKCYKGCTWADLEAGEAKCTDGTSGVTSDYTAAATAGVTDVFVSAPASSLGMLCSSDTVTASPSPPSPPPLPPYPPGAAPVPSPPSPPVSTLPPPSSPSGGICDVPEGEEGFDSLPGDCKGLIIGCVVGGVVLCLCICGLLAFKMCGKKAVARPPPSAA